MLAAAMRVAQDRLASSSEFDPFALVTDDGGRILAVDFDRAGLGKRPDSERIAAAALVQLRSLATSCRCAVLTVNTRLSQEKTDALELRVEHREGVALIAFLPYKRATFAGVTEWGSLKTYSGIREIWP